MRPDDIKWKSISYRKWIRDNCACFICNRPLADEKDGYESHHHRHAGGKNPSDLLLTALCLACHNELHANEARFNTRYGLDRDKWDQHCLNTLAKYVESLNVNPRWIMLIALQKIIVENDQTLKCGVFI